MQEYEFRILCSGRGDTIIEIMHASDSAAIRSAGIMARGRPFEVWRGLDCIHEVQFLTPQFRPLHFH